MNLGEEVVDRDAVDNAGVSDGLEWGDITPDTVHAVIDENSCGGWMRRQELGNRVARRERRAC
jgi:hypothetical protein